MRHEISRKATDLYIDHHFVTHFFGTVLKYFLEKILNILFGITCHFHRCVFEIVLKFCLPKK